MGAPWNPRPQMVGRVRTGPGAGWVTMSCSSAQGGLGSQWPEEGWAGGEGQAVVALPVSGLPLLEALGLAPGQSLQALCPPRRMETLGFGSLPRCPKASPLWAFQPPDGPQGETKLGAHGAGPAPMNAPSGRGKSLRIAAGVGGMLETGSGPAATWKKATAAGASGTEGRKDQALLQGPGLRRRHPGPSSEDGLVRPAGGVQERRGGPTVCGTLGSACPQGSSLSPQQAHCVTQDLFRVVGGRGAIQGHDSAWPPGSGPQASRVHTVAVPRCPRWA